MLGPAIAASAGAAAVHCLPALMPVVPPVARALGVSLTLPSGRGLALTFDDGPHPQGTPAVLSLLDRAGVPATFFLVGEQVERRPGLAAEIAAAGHGVALHCHRHRSLLRLTPTQVRDDLERAAAVIAQATGRVPVVHRPPYGIYSACGLAVVRRRLFPLLWSRWGHDWRARASAASVAGEVAGRLEAGDVLLLHDSDAYSARDCWRATVAGLPRILDAMRASGHEPVRADSLGAVPAP